MGQRHVRVVWWLYNKISESLGVHFRNFWLAGWTDLEPWPSMKGALCFREIDFSAVSCSTVLSQEEMTNRLSLSTVRGWDQVCHMQCHLRDWEGHVCEFQFKEFCFWNSVRITYLSYPMSLTVLGGSMEDDYLYL